MMMVHLLSRQPHLTHEQFIDHWQNVHGPLVKGHADAIGLRRYVQLHSGYQSVVDAINGPRDGEANFGGEWDGLAMSWWDSEEDFFAHVGSEEGKAAMAEIMEDEPKFSNYDRSVLLFGDEKLVIGDRKLLFGYQGD
ncbi:EthD domain-containing protein [Streptomyces sp. NPDC047081]|uniref:EthD domain-containing protein n=1 Tax=Streptomyces sp. NPDC047081 TaxID=3154706 RepID=UPI0033CF5E94